ncbi:hypothetical protein TNCV_4537901 [Trichonephila clavipes]|nr:hypothetical protein TNCV_4537901 [Trichonephila clavipes]
MITLRYLCVDSVTTLVTDLGIDPEFPISKLRKKVDEFIASTLSISQNVKNLLEERHIRTLHAGGRHPRIGPGHVMGIYMKIVNSIRGRSLQRRMFRVQL